MKLTKIALLAGALSVPSIAMAQDQAVPPEQQADTAATSDPVAVQTGEIVVTAQRREQRLQDVPLAVSAFSGQEIESRNVTDLSDMQYAVPGLSMVEYGPGQEFAQMRGIATSIGKPTVGTYYDEMPITTEAQGSTIDIRMLDLERVEVLRGPQATLYGEGSMGGTIRYITAKPDLDEFSGSASGEISDTSGGRMGYRVDGVANIPISTDRLGLRIAGGYEKIAGWVDRAPTGEEDINNARIWTLRAILRAKPTDDLTIDLIGLHQESKQDNLNFGVDNVTATTVPTLNRENTDLIQGIVRYDLGGAELTAIGGYLDRNAVGTFDLTPFYLATVNAILGLPEGFITEIGYPGPSNSRVYTAEARLASTNRGIFNWLAGASYRDSRFALRATTFTSPGTLPFDILDAEQVRKSKSYSLFGEVSVEPLPGLTLLAGVRYYEDKVRFTSRSAQFGFETFDDGQDTFDTLNPRFNISYEFNRNSMAYLNVAKGFRSGGFNLTSAGGGTTDIPLAYAPDSVWTYEAGTKHTLFGGKLFLDAAVYRTIWSDIQSSVFAPGSPLIVTINSGKVKGWGIDLSASVRPVTGLTLSGAYGWNNLRFTEVASGGFTPDKEIGDPVDFAVREAYALSAEYRMPIADQTNLFFRADYQHAGKSSIILRNFGNQIIDRPARDLVNLQAGVEFDRFEISAFAKNVFNEQAPNIIGPFGVIGEDVLQQPRVIGIQGRVRF
ncbi:TonB-dependent receptor [Sphingosinicella rhizophila]|uniref:TonB-dependent receptor n=1 Tax=Sphingosinicella rhizophila TaxID=3050082 RepID=A0ABU3Q938_9SPHN|nr:TonB-dependent receptor [Sphingosinicella sp. GR2756]MDT9599921.1 TonB-dependent receptor [Sphingosinicella sp. GR2756]